MANYILTHSGPELDAAITKSLNMGNLEDKTVSPSLNQQVVAASAGNTLDTVTVTAVTSTLLEDLDANFKAENIAKDVVVFGITGTYGGGSSAIDSSSDSYTISDPYNPWGDEKQHPVQTSVAGTPSGGTIVVQLGIQGSSNAYVSTFTFSEDKQWEPYAYAGASGHSISISSTATTGFYTFQINVSTTTQNLPAAYSYVIW